MIGLRALRLTVQDFWAEAAFITSSGLLGGLLSLLILPLPFVLAGHYGSAAQISEGSAGSWRTWFASGREHAGFFYKWVLLVAVITVGFVGNLVYYARFDAQWAAVLRGLMLSLMVLWLFPQPLVPALYLRQSDRRLRTAMRNAYVVCLTEPGTVIVLWAAILLLALPLLYFATPLLLLVQLFIPFVSTQIVALKLKRPDDEPQPG